MKTSLAGLQNSVSSIYSTTGTTTFGRAFQKTINSQGVIGPQLTQWMDIFQTYALYPQDCYYNPNTGHLFVLASSAAALTAVNTWVMLFNFSSSNSWTPTYVGKVNLNFGNSAASTPTIKGFSVYESGGNIIPCISVTGSVAIEGGTYIAYNLTTASFTVGGTTIYPASGSGQAGYMYFLQDPVALGASHAATTAWGQALPQFSGTGSVASQILQANGTFALPAMYSWNLATAPAVSSTVTSGVNSLNGGYSSATYGVSTACYLSMPPNPTYYTTFTISSLASAITAGATYTVSGITLTAGWSYASGALGIVLTSTSSSQVPSSGTLTLASGSGPATIAYTGTSQSLLFNGYALGAGGDQVVMMAGTAAVPTGLTAWSANTLQTTSNVYFTRDAQLVYNFTTSSTSSGITAGATYTVAGVTLTCSITYGSGVTTVLMNTTNGATIPSSGTLTFASGTGPAAITYSAQTSTMYFNAAATTGGAAVATTSTNSGFTMMRAFGISSNGFLLKTGNLTAITGGALVANTMNYCKPTSSPANTTLQSADCISFQANSALYLFKISDLVSLGTTWPSLNTAGIANTGTGLDITTPSAVFGEYDNPALTGGTDNFVYVTNTSTFVMKPYKVAGSALTAVFGGTTNTYYAGQNPVTVQAGLTAITQIHCNGGFLFICAAATTGQQGIVIADMGSDATFGYSGIISPVLSLPAGTTFKYIDTLEQLFNYTDSMNFWVRSASTSGSAVFSSSTLPSGSPVSAGTVSNGWTNIQTASDMSAYSVGPYFQFCITYQILTLLANTPAQLYDLIYAYLPPGESSDYWVLNVDNTTQGSGSPSYITWYQQTAYASSIPTLYVRLIDYATGAVTQQYNSVTNASLFSYSTNGGTSWNAFGTPTNAVGTLVRCLISTTPGDQQFVSIRES